jgi:hypothetical protein
VRASISFAGYRGRSWRTCARARRELTASGFGVVDRLAHRRVVHVENVVEQERGPLERGQALEGEQQRDRQIIGQRLAGFGDHGLGQPCADVVFAPVTGRLHAIEAEARDHACEVGARLRDRGAADVAPPQERILDDVLGLRDRAEHAIGQSRQERPMRLEVSNAVGRVDHAALAARFGGETVWPATTTRVQALPWPSAYFSAG